MIKSYKFVFSADSLTAPVRSDTGLCAVIPAWEKLNHPVVDQRILQEHPSIDIVSPPRLALICHAYNTAPTFLEIVANAIDLCRPTAIIFTTDSIEKEAILHAFLEEIPYTPAIARIIILPNIGRDVIPFWRSIKEISAYSDVFLKLHWKGNPHLDRFFPQEEGLKASDVWSIDIFKTLLPSSSSELDEILSLFDQNICCIFPRPWPAVSAIHWHSIENLEHFSHLLEDFSLPYSLSILPLVYPLGNMFYGSVSFFAKFADFFLERLTLPPEPIDDDGTVLHAIERIYTFLAASHGLDVAAIFPENFSRSFDGVSQPLPDVRKIVVFPVSCLANPLVGQYYPSLPVLHFSTVAASIRSLTAENFSRVQSSSKMSSLFSRYSANVYFQKFRHLMSRLVLKFLK